jgi:hypothetical protein
MIDHWTAFTVGIMMIISPWVLGFSDISLAKWCNILLGLTLVIANAWILFGESAAAAIPVVEESQKRKRKIKSTVEPK